MTRTLLGDRVGSFNAVQAAVVAVGAFYTFAGAVGLRVAVQGRFMDVAIAAISMKAPPAVETARGLWLLFSSAVVLAGGVFALLRLDWAVAAFVLSAAGQALYLLVLAPRIFDPSDPPDERGRQQTVNAFILYSAATLFVLWAYRSGALVGPRTVGWPVVWGALGLVAVATAWGLFRFFYPLTKNPLSFGRPDRDAESGEAGESLYESEACEPGPPISDSRRILVMSDYECDPLWTHDAGRSGCFSPRELPLSNALIDDLEAWSRSFDTSFNHEDYNRPNWTEDQYRAHAAAGVALARRLKRELPDRQIFVWRDIDGSMGHMEIEADE